MANFYDYWSENYKIDYKNHSNFLETVGIWGWEGVWFFLWFLSFFIISGKYYKYGELPVIINWRFFGLNAVGFFLFLVGEKSISMVLGFYLFGLSFIKFNPAYTSTRPSSSMPRSGFNYYLGSLWAEKYWLGLTLIFSVLYPIYTDLLIAIWIFYPS